jgi:hypothetical protein
MLQVTEPEVKKRLAFDNPWWSASDDSWLPADLRRERPYLDGFAHLVRNSEVRRAAVLLGPRRVGKTVLLNQAIARLVREGTDPKTICYVSVATPTYTGIGLEKLLTLFRELNGHPADARLFVIFDEIQYLKDWERHLKSLVDSYPSVRFAASGSAAAALMTGARESGAGRFTEYPLPPLSFAEFLRFRNWVPPAERAAFEEALNAELVAYLNFGGFPEAVTKAEVRTNMDRFVANDVIDKVLLRDLPSLYGITDTQELKRLFAMLAYNAGREVNLDGLAQASGVAKNTLRKYLEYLETAFLIQRVHRIGQDGRRFLRATHFKVYLTNPCIRTALFGEVSADDPAMGALAENALVSQYAHSLVVRHLRYARWAKGEVDLVVVDPRTDRPAAAIEVKWSDRGFDQLLHDTGRLIDFCVRAGLNRGIIHSRSGPYEERTVGQIKIVHALLAEACVLRGIVAISEVAAGGHPLTSSTWDVGDPLAYFKEFGDWFTAIKAPNA